VLDNTMNVSPHAIYATVLTFIAIVADFYYHFRVHKRFYGPGGMRRLYRMFGMVRAATQPQERKHGERKHNAHGATDGAHSHGTTAPNTNAAARLLNKAAGGSSAPATELTMRTGNDALRRKSCVDSVITSPLTHVGEYAHAADAGNAVNAEVSPFSRGRCSTTSEFRMCGTLSKRAAVAEEGMGRVAFRMVKTGLTGEWRDRWFVLERGTLNYWHSQAEYEAGKDGELEPPIRLGGHEVLVDTDDVRWGFALQPVNNDGRRTWYFRAPTEEERIEWAKKLVLNAMLAEPPGEGEE